MKYLPFKLIILCILAPPVLYVLTLQATDAWLQDRFQTGIENVYLGETGSLLNGNVRIQEAVGRNIDRYLRSLPLILKGQQIDVTVITKDGILIYPPVFEPSDAAMEKPADPLQVAADNYHLLSKGLVLTLRVKTSLASPLALSLLSVFILLSVGTLFWAYRKGLSKSREEESGRRQEIERLYEIKDRYAERMDRLDRERSSLFADLSRAKEELSRAKERAHRNEDAMIDEIGSLEKDLEKNLELQIEQDEVIKALQEQIRKAEKRDQKADRQKHRHREMAEKRFQALYKNLALHERAVVGFIGLSEEMKIRAEEVIHQLNADKSAISIKRKVFSKKGAVTAFEVVFGHKGRLYFRNSSQRLEVLAIGTKNTQNRDLAFLDRQ